MLLSLRKNGLAPLFKEVRVFKVLAKLWEGRAGVGKGPRAQGGGG